MNIKEFDDHKEYIISKLQTLTLEQLNQYLWLCVVRRIPEFICSLSNMISDENRSLIRSYIHLIFISAYNTYYGFTSEKYTHIKQTNSDILYAFKSLTELYRTSFFMAVDAGYYVYYIDALNMARGENGLDINTNAITILDNVSGKVRDEFPFSYTRSLETVHNFIMLFTIINDRQQFLNDISCIQLNDWKALDNSKYYFDGRRELFVSTMNNKLHLSYWLRCFENMLEHRFQPEKELLNQIATMPLELYEEDTDTSLRWLEALEKTDTKLLNEARIILLGDKGTGKTSLARRLKDPSAKMPLDKESTQGVDVSTFQLRDINMKIHEERNANVNVWDFAGHAITHAAHRCFLSERCIYIILYDGRTEDRSRSFYWLNHVRDYGGRSKVYILVNKRDDNRPNIEENYIKNIYKDNDCEFFYFSIKDDVIELEEFRQKLATHIESDPAWGQNMPTNYFTAKETLKSTFGDTTDFITLDDFMRIVPEGDDDMLKSLHALGICLHYENIDEINTLVLNPRWITEGIYKIINWLKNIQQNYRLEAEDFLTIFEDDLNRYPADKHSFLWKLMIKYELAYEDTNKKDLIVPHCLNNDQPKNEDFPKFPEGGRLCTNFYARQKDNSPMPLPPDIIPRIIVKRAAITPSELSKVWRYGAILYLEKDTYALIQQKETFIILRVAGKERQLYHDILRGTILDVFRRYTSFIGNEPDISYELVEYPNIMYPQSGLINLIEEGINIYDDKTIRKEINVQENMQQYKINFIVDKRITNVYGSSPVIGGPTLFVSDNYGDTYNFKECEITLTSRLSELAQLLEIKGTREANEVKKAVKQLKKCNTEQQYKKNKGLRALLSSIKDQLEDENSKLHKVAKALTNGAKLISDIIEAYKQITTFFG
jgi:GTPase SAR1 family protein